MVAPPCPCGAPAVVGGWCAACIALERERRAIDVTIAVEALGRLGMVKEAAEVLRRHGLYDVGPTLAELERLSH